MTPKDQEDPRPDDGEENNRPLNELVNNLGSGLTRAGSAFKKWINFELPTDEFLPSVEDRLAARERAKAQAEAAEAQARAEREKAALERAAQEQAAEEKSHQEALALARQAASGARAAAARTTDQRVSPQLQTPSMPKGRIEPTLNTATERLPSHPLPAPGRQARTEPAPGPAAQAWPAASTGSKPAPAAPPGIATTNTRAPGNPAPSTTPPARPVTQAGKPAPIRTGKRAPSEEDLRERVADDHAWIRENLERRYRGRPLPAPVAVPAPEAMDESEIRARLLKIHGGRLPGKAGRQQVEKPAVAARPSAPATQLPSALSAPILPQPTQAARSLAMPHVPSQALSPLAASMPATPLAQPPAQPLIAPAKPAIKVQRPVTSSKPRASVVKPASASLRKASAPESTPARPSAIAENPAPLPTPPAKPISVQAIPNATASAQPPAQPPTAPAKPAIEVQRPVTSSKPRASVVKPAPANLRKTSLTEPNPAQPAAIAESPATFPAALAEPTSIQLPAAALPMLDTAAIEVIAIAAPSFAADEPEAAPSPLTIGEPAVETAAITAAEKPDAVATPVLEIQTPPADDEIPSSWLRAPAPRRAQPISARLGAPARPAQAAVPTTATHTADALPPPVANEARPQERTVLSASAQIAPTEQAPENALENSPEAAMAPPASLVLQPPSVKPRIVLRPTTNPASAPVPPWQDLADAAPEGPEIQPLSEPANQELPHDNWPERTRPVSRNWVDYAPPLDLLQPASDNRIPVDEATLSDKARLIEEKLAEFRVKVDVRDAFAGPVITRYEVEPAVGVRGAQVVNLMKDLARALGVTSIRVVETIPGKTYMGLELPNVQRQMIRLSEVLCSATFQQHPSKLAMALGKDITGEPIVADLAKAPHMLVAGTTGSGKSVGVNAMILSLLYRATPAEVRFVMIDPKMLELSVYDGIPHLLAPVVTDMKLAANALHWCVTEMERRYRLMSHLGVRNLAGFNQKIRDAEASGRTLYDPEPLVPESPTPLSTLPFIVVVVDEFADLMMVAGKKIEELIARLAQKARAAGIHLILATQRPSVDVITGLIKANIPTRIAFQVSSKVDSRTILDQMGAESLLGQGDMLYLPPGTGYPQRVHGAFVADDEVHALAEHLKQYGAPDYVDAVLGAPPGSEPEEGAASSNVEESDPLYDQAVAIVIESRRASISLVQRHLRIGYNRAARLVEQMETAGIVSPMESNGSRTVLVPGN